MAGQTQSVEKASGHDAVAEASDLAVGKRTGRTARSRRALHATPATMSTTTVTTTTQPDGTTSVVVDVDGKTVLGAEEGVPPGAANARSAEEKAFLISKYPKNLESIEVDWLSTLLRATVSKMVRQRVLRPSS
jgi:hypothetical protein